MGADLKRMSIRHDEILEWLVLNPEKTKTECAAVFGVTPAWLSSVIWSDLFQARVAELREKGQEVGILSIKEKMAATAAAALDQILEQLPLTSNVDDLTKVAKVTLNGLGYGGGKAEPPAGPVQNNIYVASPESLRDARSILQQVHQVTQTPDIAGGNPQNANALPGEAVEVEDESYSHKSPPGG